MARKKPTPKEASDAAKALEVLFASEYIDRKKLYIANFWRGVFFSMGTVLGAAIVITLLLWILSLFQTTPLVGPIFDNVRETIEQQKK
jgi:hypothetical protein